MMKHQLLYLVNLCHSMDDVPMGLFENVEAAGDRPVSVVRESGKPSIVCET